MQTGGQHFDGPQPSAAHSRRMKILIWPGHHDPLDWGIKMLTHGAGTHAAFLRKAPDQNQRLRMAMAAFKAGRRMEAMVLLDGMKVHESFYPCVRTRPFTLGDLLLVEFYDLEDVSLQQHVLFEALFNQHDGFRHKIRYPIEDLFRYAVNLPARDELHGMFCSRYVMYCCRQVLRAEQLPLVRLPVKDWASPRDLRISPRLAPSRGSAPKIQPRIKL